jgi:hypothetical protein
MSSPPLIAVTAPSAGQQQKAPSALQEKAPSALQQKAPSGLQQTAPSSSTLQPNYYALPILSILTRPIVYVTASLLLFCITFGYVFILSGINLNNIDTSRLNVWWAGTFITSSVMLLIFYIVFQKGGYLNKAIIVLLLLTFIFVHISLLLTQMNLRV